MASWLSLSLFDKQQQDDDNQVDDEEEDEDHPNQNPSSPSAKSADLSAVISRQFRGFAAFLAPPPISPDSGGDSAVSPPSSPLLGIKNDLVEIGGSFKSKLSLISSNKAVTEISRFANSLLQFGDDNEEDEKVHGEGVGLSEEVVSFVEDISERSHLWTDFPLSLGDDFDMSEIQREHVAAIEEMVPSIAALRHEICKFINEDIFWMIYFILLLPRLNEYEAKLLSTPEFHSSIKNLDFGKHEAFCYVPAVDNKVQQIRTTDAVELQHNQLVETPSTEDQNVNQVVDLNNMQR